MSVPAFYGKEEDDFDYEDEHIERESENQEYEDLTDGEFEPRPAISPSAEKSHIAENQSSIEKPPPERLSAPPTPAKNKRVGTSPNARKPTAKGSPSRKKAEQAEKTAPKKRTSEVISRKPPAKKKPLKRRRKR